MKLSEAIKAGAAITKPAYGKLFRNRGKSACALGAAIIGVIGLKRAIAMDWKSLADLFPDLLKSCPPEIYANVEELTTDALKLVFYNEDDTVHGAIKVLNDDYRLPRETIADWLEEVGL